MSKMSIIIPAYNEALMIRKTEQTIKLILNENKINYELIFVNDGSKDNTWLEIESLCRDNKNIVGINFSRNFGKESAIFAGLDYVNGDCCVVIDCDLQHPPELLVEMHERWKEGYKVVEGVKSSRGKESYIYKWCAKSFYKSISLLSGIDMYNTSDYKLMDKKVVEILKSMPEKHMFFRALSSWVGFKSIKIPYEVRDRELGESKWSVFKLTKYAISNITSFSALPMQLVTLCGIVFFLFALILGIQSLYFYIKGFSAEGFTTVIIILLIMGSVIMLSLGIIGYYIAKIYEEIKGRPRYILSEYLNCKEDKSIKESELF